MSEINIGDIVKADYNSGLYVGEVMEDRRNLFLIKVLAVIKHPTQGDLHNPGQVDGVAFHERKALADQELTNVSKRKVHPYAGEVPIYSESLKEAVAVLKTELQSKDTQYNKAAMQKLLDLEEYYYKKTDYS